MEEDAPSGVNANQAVSIKVGEHKFQPEFTYPIYGDEEIIEGHAKAEINLELDALTLLPLLETKLEKAAPDAPDPISPLVENLPAAVFFDREEWQAAVTRERADFKLPGEEVFKFGEFHAHYTKITPKSRILLERFKIFVLFFIEAGTFIDDTDVFWSMYLLYKNDQFAGFCTTYSYLYFKSSADFQSRELSLRRKRISQFVILPPHQGRGVGQRFYEGIVRHLQADPLVGQITVEDPSSAFDTLRNRGDLKLLAQTSGWKGLGLPPAKDQVDAVIEESKLAPQQVRECIRIDFLRRYETEPEAYRLMVKQHLYEVNYEGIKNRQHEELEALLRDTYYTVTEGYRQVLGLNFKDEPEAKRPRLLDSQAL